MTNKHNMNQHLYRVGQKTDHF